jgi:hypothetical protein
VAPQPSTYHPDAQREADARQAAFEQPADPLVIQRWAEMLAAGNANAPRAAGDFAVWLTALVFTCGDDVPGVAWDDASLRQAMRTFRKFWPNVGEVFELLEARTARLRQEISALRNIALGQRGPRNAIRPSREYLDSLLAAGTSCVPPKKPSHWSSTRPGIADDFDDMRGRSTIPVVAPVRTVAQQLAALSVQPGETDLLAARREALQPTPATPEPDTPPEPAPEEIGGPVAPHLKVVK